MAKAEESETSARDSFLELVRQGQGARRSVEQAASDALEMLSAAPLISVWHQRVLDEVPQLIAGDQALLTFENTIGRSESQRIIVGLEGLVVGRIEAEERGELDRRQLEESIWELRKSVLPRLDALLECLTSLVEAVPQKAQGGSGAFHVLEKLEDGAFADVWRAEDGLGRTVAVKFIRPSMESEVGVMEHARSLARTSHPNVVTLHAVQKIVNPDTGLPQDALVMEFIAGSTLKERLANSFSVEEVVTCAHGLLDGVAHIHERGLAHGDLHEGNVMLGEQGVKIIDILYRDTLGAMVTTVRSERLKADLRSVVRHIQSMLDRLEPPLSRGAEFSREVGEVGEVGEVRKALISVLPATNVDGGVIDDIDGFAGWLVAQPELLPRLLRNTPSLLRLLSGYPRELKELWATRLFAGEEDLEVFVELLKSGLIPAADYPKLLERAASDTGMGVLDDPVLDTSGFWGVFDRLLDEQLGHFRWANRNSPLIAYRVSLLVEGGRFGERLAVNICDTFRHANHPYGLLPRLQKVFSHDSDAYLQLQLQTASAGCEIPGRLTPAVST